MKLTKRIDLFQIIFAAILFATSFAAQAQLTIEITGAGANRFPVAVAAFEGEAALPRGITEVVRGDLERSGLFSLVELGPSPIGEAVIPDFGNIKYRGADAVAVGSVLPADSGRFEVRFRLYDTQRQESLGGLALRTAPAQYRATGHRIADYIFEKLTGLPGVFSTRIAYVVKTGSRFELQIADADGQNAQTALASREPIISPSWSPDGGRLAYVSFEAKKPVIYVHSLSSGLRQVAANFRGSNSAPAWAPDGQRLAVTLTKDGQSQIYTVNADGSGVRRLASSSGIDTEPFWSADGQHIYFTSDRGGSPQIYRIPSTGGDAQRITFEGSYNVTPRLSPDGKSLAYVTRISGNFQVAVMDLATRQTAILTDSSRDESPSFAPNGRMILYATDNGGRGVLAAVSADGRLKQRLSVQAADVREPAWGPLSK
jgi:TolB protein